DILVLDGGADAAPGRVLVFASHGFALRAVWLPPKGAVAQPWRPSAIAIAPDRRAFVADIAHGALHVFDRRGGRRRAVAGVLAGRGGWDSARSPGWRSTASAASIPMSTAIRRFASRTRAAKRSPRPPASTRCAPALRACRTS